MTTAKRPRYDFSDSDSDTESRKTTVTVVETVTTAAVRANGNHTLPAENPSTVGRPGWIRAKRSAEDSAAKKSASTSSSDNEANPSQSPKRADSKSSTRSEIPPPKQLELVGWELPSVPLQKDQMKMTEALVRAAYNRAEWLVPKKHLPRILGVPAPSTYHDSESNYTFVVYAIPPEKEELAEEQSSENPFQFICHNEKHRLEPLMKKANESTTEEQQWDKLRLIATKLKNEFTVGKRSSMDPISKLSNLSGALSKLAPMEVTKATFAELEDVDRCTGWPTFVGYASIAIPDFESNTFKFVDTLSDTLTATNSKKSARKEASETLMQLILSNWQNL